MPIASETTLVGVKIGENISVTPDGTISATGASVSDDDIVTSDETDEMLDEIFSPEP